MLKKIVFSLLIANYSMLIGQTMFQRSVSAGQFTADIANCIIRATDGGYVFAGSLTAYMYTAKVDAVGSPVWSRVLQPVGIPSFGYCLGQTTDGGYILAGHTTSSGNDFYIVKLNSGGSIQWQKEVGGAGAENAYSIIQTTDGGYIAAGNTSTFGAGNFDMYIVKLDANGSFQWSRTIGGPDYDEAYSIIQTTDGGYVAAGSTNSFGAGLSDMYIVKLDANGSLQWSRTAGGTNTDYAYSIVRTVDGGYAATGSTVSFGAGSVDMYIVKLDANGSLQWNRTVGGTNNDIAYSIIQTIDSGYVAAGQTNSFGAGQDDMYIAKLGTTGTLQWSKAIGGPNLDNARSVIQTPDGRYVAAGRTPGQGGTDIYMVILDANGNTCGNSTIPPSLSGTGGSSIPSPSTITSITPTITPVTTTFNLGVPLVTPVCTFTGIRPVSNEIPDSYKLYQNYPNPFNPKTKIRFSLPALSEGVVQDVRLIVYDNLGRQVATLVNEKLRAGTYEVEWPACRSCGAGRDASNYPSGVYYYKLEADGFADVKKMVLVK